MSRSWPYLLLVLAACRPSSTTGTTEGAPSSSASAAPSPSASSPPPKPARGFASGGVIARGAEICRSSTWRTARGPHSPRRASTPSSARARPRLPFPGDKAIGGSEPSNASFTNDGKRFFVVRRGATSSSNEVTIHATSDLRVITKLANAFDPRWIDDDVVFDRDGQGLPADGQRDRKLIGPPKPAFRERPRAVVVAPNLESMIVVDQLDRRVSGVRRVALTASGHDALLVSSEVLAKFSKSAEPIAVVAPDASRVCIVGPIRSETAIWCASDDTPAEQIVSFVDSEQAVRGVVRRSEHPLVSATDRGRRPGSRTSTRAPRRRSRSPAAPPPPILRPLPGGRLAVARDFYRLGIVDLAARQSSRRSATIARRPRRSPV